ncbi:hypothetical protein OIU76_012425 [Salix suchowensis]|nr:hypothetical protein OIU76_012425 [Salix suchowensis]KAJ6357810.1 hypothetical protein OIU78_005613 [Salix suchowensis]
MNHKLYFDIFPEPRLLTSFDFVRLSYL